MREDEERRPLRLLCVGDEPLSGCRERKLRHKNLKKVDFKKLTLLKNRHEINLIKYIFKYYQFCYNINNKLFSNSLTIYKHTKVKNLKEKLEFI